MRRLAFAIERHNEREADGYFCCRDSDDEEHSDDVDKKVDFAQQRDQKHVTEKKRKKKVTDTCAAKLAQIKQEQVRS